MVEEVEMAAAAAAVVSKIPHFDPDAALTLMVSMMQEVRRATKRNCVTEFPFVRRKNTITY
jgi:hypothetical protein